MAKTNKPKVRAWLVEWQEFDKPHWRIRRVLFEIAEDEGWREAHYYAADFRTNAKERPEMYRKVRGPVALVERQD